MSSHVLNCVLCSVVSSICSVSYILTEMMELRGSQVGTWTLVALCGVARIYFGWKRACVSVQAVLNPANRCT